MTREGSRSSRVKKVQIVQGIQGVILKPCLLVSNKEIV
jgi:hypothetical protein